MISEAKSFWAAICPNRAFSTLRCFFIASFHALQCEKQENKKFPSCCNTFVSFSTGLFKSCLYTMWCLNSLILFRLLQGGIIFLCVRSSGRLWLTKSPERKSMKYFLFKDERNHTIWQRSVNIFAITATAIVTVFYVRI